MVVRRWPPVAAVCDGAGNAGQAARSAVNLFHSLVREGALGHLLVPPTRGLGE